MGRKFIKNLDGKIIIGAFYMLLNLMMFDKFTVLSIDDIMILRV